MITVLIRCSDDFRVFDCIDSIKKSSSECRIIVSLTSNKTLEKKMKTDKVTYCEVPKCNAAITNLEGLKLVRTNKVIITDCDTIFEKKAINLLDKALDKYDVVKPRLIFRLKVFPGYFSPAANLRTFFNDNDEKMYIPGISFRMDIKDKIGGYFFDKNITWGEDSEFSDRVTQYKLKTKVINKALLYHPSVGAVHDLTDAFLIGLKKYKSKSKTNVLAKRLKFCVKLLTTFGIPTVLYGILWYSLFDIGKVIAKTKKLQRQAELISWKVLKEKK